MVTEHTIRVKLAPIHHIYAVVREYKQTRSRLILLTFCHPTRPTTPPTAGLISQPDLMLWKVSAPDPLDSTATSSLWSDSTLTSLHARRALEPPCRGSEPTRKASAAHGCDVVSDSSSSLNDLSASAALKAAEGRAARAEDALLPPLDESLTLSACFVEVKSQRCCELRELCRAFGIAYMVLIFFCFFMYV